MLKKFFAMIFCMAVFVNIADAADSEKPRVVVMDLGARQSSDIDTKNIGSSASDLLLQALFDTGKFKIYDWEDAEDAINAANLPTSGIIPRSAAQKIAELLNADYLIYGNINSLNSKDLIFEIAGNGGNFRSVKATMIIRVMVTHCNRYPVIGIMTTAATTMPLFLYTPTTGPSPPPST